MKLTHVRRDSQDMARDFRDRTFVDAKKSLNHEIDKLVRTGRPEQQTVSDLKRVSSNPQRFPPALRYVFSLLGPSLPASSVSSAGF